MTYLVDVVALSKTHCQNPIQCELVYATKENIVGRVIDGYHREAMDFCLLTPKAAKALCEVQNFLNKSYQLGLYVYDAYRPKRAVLDFLKWSQSPPENEYELQRKAIHYPHLEKNTLFDLGYFSDDSNHCYGNTVDLVLVDSKTNRVLEMGAVFDYMDSISGLNVREEEIGAEAFRNRQILINSMTQFGFEPYVNEFWHFCHGGRAGSEVKGPLDIEITSELKGAPIL